MTASTKVVIQQATKVFKSAAGAQVEALEPVDLEIQDGEFLSLVGPSGCGKSTLLNMIAGFDTPTAGSVLVDAQPVRSPSAARGMMFQQYALFPWLTVSKNIAFGPISLGVPEVECERRVREGIRLARLEGFGDKYPHELSGGMRQRCALARCLATDPDILLMDEPLAALDAMTREKLQDELQQIWREASARRRKTVVYVTHSIDEALFLSDRIVVMKAHPGRIIETIPVAFARPRLANVRFSDEFHRMQRHIWTLLHSGAATDGEE